MAESSETKNIKLTLKTPKEKKDVEVSEEASIKEVTSSCLIVLLDKKKLDFSPLVWFML